VTTEEVSSDTLNRAEQFMKEVCPNFPQEPDRRVQLFRHELLLLLALFHDSDAGCTYIPKNALEAIG